MESWACLPFEQAVKDESDLYYFVVTVGISTSLYFAEHLGKEV